MIEYFILVLAIPLGIIMARLTDDEKKIYSRAPYFPVILWVLAIFAAVFFSLDRVIGFTLAFVFLAVLVWSKV